MSNCRYFFGKEKVTCSFCRGERFASMCSEWNQDVICCVNCAKTVLPVMIADALHMPAGKSPVTLVDDLWNGILKACFLRGVLSRSEAKKLPDGD